MARFGRRRGRPRHSESLPRAASPIPSGPSEGSDGLEGIQLTQKRSVVAAKVGATQRVVDLSDEEESARTAPRRITKTLKRTVPVIYLDGDSSGDEVIHVDPPPSSTRRKGPKANPQHPVSPPPTAISQSSTRVSTRSTRAAGTLEPQVVKTRPGSRGNTAPSRIVSKSSTPFVEIPRLSRAQQRAYTPWDEAEATTRRQEGQISLSATKGRDPIPVASGSRSPLKSKTYNGLYWP